MDDLDQPWVPKGLPEWQLGDEVTVDLGECGQIGGHHGTQEQGVRGIVVALDGTQDGHPILVYYRHPLPAKGWTGYYARHELRAFDVMDVIREMAADLERGFKISQRFWLNLETSYRVWLRKQRRPVR